MASLRLVLVLLGILIAIKPQQAENLSLLDIAKQLGSRFLLQNVEEAKELVDAAYEYTQNRLKEKLMKKTVRPSDILVSFKQPVGKTRLHVKAAHYMLVALDLLKEKLQDVIPQEFNITDVLSPSQIQIIYKASGCALQDASTQSCDETSPYRTITGECNNLRIPTFGASNRPYARWLPQEYEDGISLPRGWTETKLYSGFPLPSVRAVSNDIVFFPNVNVTDDPFRSLMFMQWGQFLDHDLDFGPSTTATLTFMRGIDCGRSCVKGPPCFPIQIPPNDPSKPQGDCIPFTRAAPACNGGYAIRNQINALTSFVDASMVYASEDRWAMQLRNFTNNLGLLAINEMFTDRGLAYLPFGNPEDFPESCNRTNPDFPIPCFLAGDNRVTEMPGLTALQTLFMREHNHLSTELKRLNPQMNGEELYQESRKILGAMMQKITYTEYLPAVLGNSMTPYRGYNDSVDPRIASVFTIAFRFGHTLVRPTVPRLDSRYQLLSQIPLEEEFFATWRIIQDGGIDPILRGLIGISAKRLRQDQIVVEALRDRLFQQVARIGLDLPALNMQRGRDHGLPGYNAWRQFCGLSQPRNEAQLAQVLQNPQLARKLIQHYGTPNNIDLWIGGVAEPFVRNGRVGPLLACIIGKQLQNVRDGDRFWWENSGVFTPAQRQALNRVTLSRIICDNTFIREVPQFIFRANQYPRNFVSCNTIPMFSLFPWKKSSE
ncbi:myeloperoxidase isoform X2 [Python bivittatus]|uniref:Myeloperoxidase isoform X2 n=1 Tax=Python bivittatus TaxID=176946 RepID=A0A9F5ISM7_PYTBI|nr:myeloperoxidase isoform X2 [Python bivittatus]